MAIEFNKINKIILITSATNQVSIQELINSIRDYEDENENLEVSTIANAYGKQDLGGGAVVGITLELINDWRIQFEDRGGPDYIPCRIYGGNLVAINQYSNNPIKPSAYTQVVIAQSSSPTIVETGVSGLTEEESTKLMGLPSAPENADAIWDESTSDHANPDTFGQTIDKVDKGVRFIKSVSI